MHHYKKIKRRSLSTLAYAVRMKKKLAVDVSLATMSMILSEGGIFDENAPTFVADFGTLTVTTNDDDDDDEDDDDDDDNDNDNDNDSDNDDSSSHIHSSVFFFHSLSYYFQHCSLSKFGSLLNIFTEFICVNPLFHLIYIFSGRFNYQTFWSLFFWPVALSNCCLFSSRR